MHTYIPFPYTPGSTKGISAETDTEHYERVYKPLVARRNEIERLLKTARRVEEYLPLKHEEREVASAHVLHELYWNMRSAHGNPLVADRYIYDRLGEEFGSVEGWMRDVMLCAESVGGDGWAVLAFDPSDGRVRMAACGTDGCGIWGAVPLLAIDLYAHAYARDFGTDRTRYVEAYLAGVDWKKVDVRFQNISMTF